MSLSSHKVYGVRAQKASARSMLVKNEDVRSGTLSSFSCAGFEAACEIAQKEYEYDKEWIVYDTCQKKLRIGIEERIPEVIKNGDPEQMIQVL
ncbi:hypothetical protein IV203_022567 [Nitzschia inconspicua]|uniref:Uncharacterized protein n=1 Tax=Nitzschia inconspicua TaxID=303405 RepID=A0A9K3KK64_9STRA|nr:hypothetical protein IV203_022567 [Nitzschia inconspicua]